VGDKQLEITLTACVALITYHKGF